MPVTIRNQLEEVANRPRLQKAAPEEPLYASVLATIGLADRRQAESVRDNCVGVKGSSAMRGPVMWPLSTRSVADREDIGDCYEEGKRVENGCDSGEHALDHDHQFMEVSKHAD